MTLIKEIGNRNNREEKNRLRYSSNTPRKMIRKSEDDNLYLNIDSFNNTGKNKEFNLANYSSLKLLSNNLLDKIPIPLNPNKKIISNNFISPIKIKYTKSTPQFNSINKKNKYKFKYNLSKEDKNDILNINNIEEKENLEGNSNDINNKNILLEKKKDLDFLDNNSDNYDKNNKNENKTSDVNNYISNYFFEIKAKKPIEIVSLFSFEFNGKKSIEKIEEKNNNDKITLDEIKVKDKKNDKDDNDNNKKQISNNTQLKLEIKSKNNKQSDTKNNNNNKNKNKKALDTISSGLKITKSLSNIKENENKSFKSLESKQNIINDDFIIENLTEIKPIKICELINPISFEVKAFIPSSDIISITSSEANIMKKLLSDLKPIKNNITEKITIKEINDIKINKNIKKNFTSEKLIKNIKENKSKKNFNNIIDNKFLIPSQKKEKDTEKNLKLQINEINKNDILYNFELDSIPIKEKEKEIEQNHKNKIETNINNFSFIREIISPFKDIDEIKEKNYSPISINSKKSNDKNKKSIKKISNLKKPIKSLKIFNILDKNDPLLFKSKNEKYLKSSKIIETKSSNIKMERKYTPLISKVSFNLKEKEENFYTFINTEDTIPEPDFNNKIVEEEKGKMLKEVEKPLEEPLKEEEYYDQNIKEKEKAYEKIKENIFPEIKTVEISSDLKPTICSDTLVTKTSEIKSKKGEIRKEINNSNKNLKKKTTFTNTNTNTNKTTITKMNTKTNTSMYANPFDTEDKIKNEKSNPNNINKNKNKDFNKNINNNINKNSITNKKQLIKSIKSVNLNNVAKSFEENILTLEKTSDKIIEKKTEEKINKNKLLSKKTLEIKDFNLTNKINSKKKLVLVLNENEEKNIGKEKRIEKDIKKEKIKIKENVTENENSLKRCNTQKNISIKNLGKRKKNNSKIDEREKALNDILSNINLATEQDVKLDLSKFQASFYHDNNSENLNGSLRSFENSDFKCV